LDLSTDERKQFSLDHSLSEDARKALNITPSQYDKWLGEEEKEEVEQETISDFAAKDESKEEEKGIFDF